MHHSQLTFSTKLHDPKIDDDKQNVNHELPRFTRTLFGKYVKRNIIDPAVVAQWIECWPENQEVPSSIPNEGTCLCCGLGPQQGALKRQLHTDVSLSLSPSLPLFLQINKTFKKEILLIGTSLDVLFLEDIPVFSYMFEDIPPYFYPCATLLIRKIKERLNGLEVTGPPVIISFHW